MLETEDRGGATQPLVLLGRRRRAGARRGDPREPSPGLDDPGRICVTCVAWPSGRPDADLAAAAVALAPGTARCHCPLWAVLEPEMAGWVLRCREEGTEHFPRTDPAVIMAVRDGGDRLLLARNAHFPSRFHSVLAGFVEPGESLENAVAREVAEEVGVEVEAVEYVGSQPWPFPRSLMLGFRAWAPGAGELTLQEEEIAEARWFTREELAAALEAEEIALPGAASMGRALIDDWFGDLGAR